MRKTPGLRRCGTSLEAYGRVNGQYFSRRFPADTPLAVIRTWRRTKADELRKQHPTTLRGSLAEVVAEFLTLETGRRRTDFEILLGHWVQALGATNRAVLTPAQIQGQLDAWKRDGVAASTLNHRRQALRTLYRRMEPDLTNPVDKTDGFAQPEPLPRAIPEAVLEAVFAVMPDSATKARLLVICHTGMRQSELMRVRPEDVHLDGLGAHVFVQSGKGGRPRVVPLHTLAQAAFRELIARQAWGPFCVSSMRKVWLHAALRAGYATRDPHSTGTWKNILCPYRPYDLRHRFATRVRTLGADLADVQELLGHRDIRTTRRYAPVVHAKLQSVVHALVPEVVPPVVEGPEPVEPE